MTTVRLHGKCPQELSLEAIRLMATGWSLCGVIAAFWEMNEVSGLPQCYWTLLVGLEGADGLP